MNHTSRSGSSVLLIACRFFFPLAHGPFETGKVVNCDEALFEKKYAIVQFLVESGAQVNSASENGMTPLLAAIESGFVNPGLVFYLVKKGANIHSSDKFGSSAIHLAAERGCLNLVKEFMTLDVSPKLLDCSGQSALIRAAFRWQDDVVEYLISRPEFTRLECIDALELLGASYINRQDIMGIVNVSWPLHQDIAAADYEKGYKFLMQGLEARYSDRLNVLFKPTMPLIVAFGSRTESKSPEELQSIRKNDDALMMEGFLVRERILGASSLDVIEAVITRASNCFYRAVIEDTEKQRSLQLYKHAIYLNQKQLQYSRLSIKVFWEVLTLFRTLFTENGTFQLPLCEVLDIFEFVIAELQILIRRKQQLSMTSREAKTFESATKVAYDFIWYLTKCHSKDVEEKRLYQFVRDFLRLNLCTSSGATPLHLAVDGDFQPSRKIPDVEVVQLLIQSGMNVNVRDNHGDTALHVIATYTPDPYYCQKYPEENMGFGPAESIISHLIHAGAHLDIRNAAGELPVDKALLDESKFLLNGLMWKHTRLSCLAARVVKQYSLPYKGIIPKDMECFLEWH